MLTMIVDKIYIAQNVTVNMMSTLTAVRILVARKATINKNINSDS